MCVLYSRGIQSRDVGNSLPVVLGDRLIAFFNDMGGANAEALAIFFLDPFAIWIPLFAVVLE